jgi:hypothetical protein
MPRLGAAVSCHHDELASSIMLVNRSTILDIDADSAWKLVKRISTFRYVTRGILAWTPDDQQEEWQEGQMFRLRLRLFHLIPTWHHQLRIVSLNNHQREIRTEEQGGLLRKWNHTISVEPVSSSSCRYTDSVDIGGRLLTPAIWAIAQLFFRYRQLRLRKLTRSGAKGSSP